MPITSWMEFDGIAGGVAVSAGLGWMWLSFASGHWGNSFVFWIALAISASSLVFWDTTGRLRKFFMGDVASTSLGYSFAVLPLLAEKGGDGAQRRCFCYGPSSWMPGDLPQTPDQWRKGFFRASFTFISTAGDRRLFSMRRSVSVDLFIFCGLSLLYGRVDIRLPRHSSSWDYRLFGFSCPVTLPNYEMLRQNSKSRILSGV